ncbi:MAG TPA: MFS transporter [Virgibacillus sp.]|nr:MFS transporter [Virgibacillus sp.]
MSHNTIAREQTKQWYQILVLIGIVIVAFNLRPGMTSVGPLIGIIRDDVGLANWSAGLLTSLPLIAFAVMSPIVPSLGNRYTNERIMVVGLAILIVGIGIRSISLMLFLFVGTILVGVGIAICNVLLPGVVKEKFPQKVGLMTSVYSTSMGIFAAIASGLSVPFANGLGWGWQLSLIIWSIPAFIGIIIWFVLSKYNNNDKGTDLRYVGLNDTQIWRSPLAWQVALFMGFQSSLFYVTISWLPEILHDSGLSIATAGWMLSFTQIIGMPASFIVPVLAGRMKSQQSIVLTLGISALVGFTGLLLGNSFIVILISVTFIGITLGGMFALALTFLAMRARDARHASYLSGMAQAIGYSIAAMGPIAIGYIHDVTNAWKVPLLTLIGITCVVIFFGLGAGRDLYVLEED